MTRILTAILAFALLGLTPLAFSSTATAAPAAPTAASAASTATAGVVAERKKTRTVTITFTPTSGAFRLQGKVTPTGKSKKITVKLVRANCRSCAYKPFKSTKTNNAGRYVFSGLKTTGFFAAKVPASKGFKASASRVKQIIKN